MGPFVGLKADDVRTSSEGEQFKLGTLGSIESADGTKVYMYVEAGEAITAAGYLCIVDSLFVAEMVDTTSTAPGAGVGKQCGGAQAAIASGGFGWIQVYGKGPLRTLASAAVGTRLNSTATPGAVDDDGTAGSEQIIGLTLNTATGGAEATNADAFFNWPSVSVTI